MNELNRQEQVKIIIAQMNVFAQHQKAMAEFTSPLEKVKNIKIKIMKKG